MDVVAWSISTSRQSIPSFALDSGIAAVSPFFQAKLVALFASIPVLACGMAWVTTLCGLGLSVVQLLNKSANPMARNLIVRVNITVLMQIQNLKIKKPACEQTGLAYPS